MVLGQSGGSAQASVGALPDRVRDRDGGLDPRHARQPAGRAAHALHADGARQRRTGAQSYVEVWRAQRHPPAHHEPGQAQLHKSIYTLY